MNSKLTRRMLSTIAVAFLLAIIFGLAPQTAMPVYADATEVDFSSYVNNPNVKVSFNDSDWFVIGYKTLGITSPDYTITLLAADYWSGESFSDNNADPRNSYSKSLIKGKLHKYYIGINYDFSNAIDYVDLEDVNVDATNLWSLSETEASKVSSDILKCNKGSLEIDSNYWWLRSPGNGSDRVAVVNGDTGQVNSNGEDAGNKYALRPAVRLKLNEVGFVADTNTFTVTETFSCMIKKGKITYMHDWNNKNHIPAGIAVRIKANDPVGAFKEWKGADGLTFIEGNKTTAEALFTMPARDVDLEATYTTVSNHQHDGISFFEWTDSLATEQNGSGCTASNTLPKLNGSYYLSRDVTLSGPWEVPVGTTNLCLNGHTITSKYDENAIEFETDDNAHTLNLYDDHIGEKAGKIISDESGVRFNKNGNSATPNTFNMYGGKILTGKTERCDEGVYLVAPGAVFNMYGGEISNCAYGVDLENPNASFNMYGGEITGSTRGVNVRGTFNVKGAPKIAGNTNYNVYLPSDKEINVTGALTDGATIGVTLDSDDGAGIFAVPGENYTITDTDKAKFTPDDAEKLEVNLIAEGDDKGKLELKKKSVTPPVQHTHNFSYSVGTGVAANTITASCGNTGCGINSGLNMTITAPTNLTYNEQAKAASLNSDYNKTAFPDTYTIYYEGINGTTYNKTTTPPINAGNYKATVSVGDKTASISFEITKAGQTAPGAPTAIDVTSTTVTLEKTNRYQYSKDRTSWQDSNIFTNLSASTEYTFYQRVAEDDNHEASPASSGKDVKTTQYTLFFDHGEGSGTMDPIGVSDNDEFEFPECTFTNPDGKTFIRWEMSGVDGIGGIFVPKEKVTITKNCALGGVITVTAHWDDATAATITTSPEEKDLTYDGTDQELVSEGTAKNGEIRYIIGDSDTTAPTTQTADWSKTVPEATNAGTYYVWYKAVGAKGYSDSEAKCCPAKIKEKAVTVTANDQTINEGDSIKTGTDHATLSGALNGHKLSEVTLKADTTDKKIVPDKAKIVDANDKDVTGNYDVSYVDGTLTIIKPSPRPVGPTPAERVAEEIKRLPEPVTLADKDQVDKAKKDYNNLNDYQKGQISKNLTDKLNRAVDTIAALLVGKEMEELPDTITLADKDQIDKVRKDYEELTDFQKEQITKEQLDKLVRAENAIVVLTVEAQVSMLPDPVTLDDEETVNAAVEAYLALTDSQKEMFSPVILQKLADAEDTIITAKAKSKKTKISSAKNKKRRKAVVKWKKTSGASGYRVRYSTSRKFKKGVKTKKAKADAKSMTLKKLKKGRTYYIKVQPSTEVTNRITEETKVVYGKASAVKKVKIKK